jgi:predicted metal-dependent phosphoesterase TrpH
MNAGGPAYVPKETMPLADAVDLIHGAGGLAFVAHPGLGKTTRKLLPELLTYPFDGIEAYHVSHSPGRVEEFTTLAQERGLLITGGSDCHGTIKGKALLGSVRTPVAVYEAMLNALSR